MSWHETMCMDCGKSIRWSGQLLRPPACAICGSQPEVTRDMHAPPGPPTSDLSRYESHVMPFGKYRNKTLGEIARADLQYLDWLAGQSIRDRNLAIAVAAICSARSEEIERAIGLDDC